MVAIAPFRALRYNPPIIQDLSRVLAPPYDVISSDEQEQLYARSPYNVIRLIYGKQVPGDDEANNRYTRAKQTFDAWCLQQVLLRDAAEALYLYEHTFVWLGQRWTRRGIIGLLELSGEKPAQVLRHEATFDAPKADRTRLLEAVRANLSPIFCVVPDPHRQVQELLEACTSRQPPLATAQVPARSPGSPAEAREDVRLWALTDPDIIQQLQQALAPVEVLIADGHHRFEVAWSQRSRYGAIMSFFACLEDPALIIQPIHRVVRLGAAAAQWRQQLRTFCHLEVADSLEELLQWVAAQPGQGRFGYYERNRCVRVTVRPERLAQWLLRPSMALPLAGLDVTILHQVLIPQLLGLMPTVEHIQYTPNATQARALVDQEPDSCAWFLRGLSLPQVYAFASQGLRLPQKTTYFYPKVPSGLCINPCDR